MQDCNGFPEQPRVPVGGLAQSGKVGQRIADLANRFIYEHIAGRWVKYPFTNFIATPVNLVYSSDGDTNGLFTYLGTKANTIAWANPFIAANQISTNKYTEPTSGVSMLLAGWLTGQTDPPGITDHTGGHVHIQADGTGLWMAFDMGSGGSFALSKWNLMNRDNSADGATSVTVAGSNDGTVYTTIQSVTGRTAATNAWSGGVPTDTTTAYRFIRILMTAGGTYFTIGELELYGTYLAATN